MQSIKAACTNSREKFQYLVPKMVIYFLFFAVVLIHHECAAVQDECIESRCSKHGPIIRFPFRLKDKQPDHCGYSGFELSCVRNKHTLLELPNSVKLYIRKIDYQSKLLYLYDPDKCLLKSLANLSLPSTFSFDFFQTYKFNCTLFNCKSFHTIYANFFEVSCLKYANGYKVYAVDSAFRMQYAAFSSCTKMYDIQSVPNNIGDSNDLLLNWRKPDCNYCEVAGMKCKLRNNSTTETECYGALLKTVKDKRAKVWIGVSIPCSVVLALVVTILCLMYRADRRDKENQAKIEKFLEDYKALRPARYSYADIKRITNNFKHKLGQGSYGTVFKGKLSAEIAVAVKMLNDSKGNGEEFINEVGTMGQIHHVNVVRLVGFCADGFIRALVYEFLPNKSLDKFISPIDRGNYNHALGWDKLLDIAVGVGKGIEYLHQGCKRRILHFDIKPQNVLLDQNFNPKIADFGLAKLCSKDRSVVSMTTARGTVGYIAPEVLSRNFGNVSYKSDVYSFGKLLLEMVGGRKGSDVTTEESKQDFPEWVHNRLEQGEDIRIQIDEEGDVKIIEKLAMVGIWCIQWNPVDRPSMKVVVQMLEGERDDLPMPPNPFAASTNKKTYGGIAGRHLHQELDVISEVEAE